MKKKIIIEGKKVHHVGYRPFLLAKAWELEIPNYFARNVKEDGKQKVIVSLGGEERQVQKFVDFAKKNYPPQAQVSKVKEGKPPERIMPIEKYDRVLSSEQQSTTVQAGLGMIKMQKKTIEMQKETTNKLDSFHQDTIQKFDNLDEKYSRISQNMERILEEMKEERKEYRTSIEKLVNAILSQKSKE